MQRRESTKQPPRVRIPRAASHPHAELASVSQEQHCVRALTKSRAGYRLRSGAEPGTALPGSTEHRQRSRRPGRRGWPGCSAPQERKRVSAPSRHRRPEATCVEALAAPPRPCPRPQTGLTASVLHTQNHRDRNRHGLCSLSHEALEKHQVSNLRLSPHFSRYSVGQAWPQKVFRSLGYWPQGPAPH